MDVMDFTDEQIDRYARHLVLPEIGEDGQARLLDSRVLVIGAGGLGSPLLLYLAAAGVGTLGVVDDDDVDLSNLQRQVLHDSSKIGEPKVASAQARLAEINPEVRVVAHRERLTSGRAMDLIQAYDLVADGSDNFATRYVVNDACYLAKKTLVSAAIMRFDGQISTYKAQQGPPASSRGQCRRRGRPPLLPLRLWRSAGGLQGELRRRGCFGGAARHPGGAAGDRGDQGAARHRRQPVRAPHPL
jgi:adenylyltransferase/sulfurtransferase